MKRKMLVALLCGMHVVFAAPPVAVSNDRALQFDAEAKQRTPEPGEATVEFIFACTNVSKKMVSITGLHTSCGCTVAQLPAMPYPLQPGSNVSIHVSMNIAGKQGLVRKSVSVESTSGLQSLLVSADIPTPKTTDTK